MKAKAEFPSLDKYSNLPQNIIENILCLVPIKNAVRTSILSRNWRYNWVTIPKLVFSEKDIFDRTTFEEEREELSRRLSLGEEDFTKLTLEREELKRKLTLEIDESTGKLTLEKAELIRKLMLEEEELMRKLTLEGKELIRKFTLEWEELLGKFKSKMFNVTFIYVLIASINGLVVK
nr:hypothetical protein [Tanacetum cinerariifolium]